MNIEAITLFVVGTATIAIMYFASTGFLDD